MTRYELLDRIGVGGMAEIFRGKAVAAGGFEKPVAIKRILPHLSQDQRFVELLIAEAKVLSLLKHRNIVQIFDVGLGDDGQYFLVMEYVDGKDIGAIQRSLENKRRRIPFDLALHIGAEICEALEHAHGARAPDGKSMSLVHRDVSPSNVLLSRAGEVKLTDFGIAKRAEQDPTRAGAIKGKFAYISPEQARNEQLDPRSDVFSVGILMWELICNRRLFSGLEDLAALRAVRDAQIARPTEIDPRLPGEIDNLLMMALSRDKSRRYPSAGQFGQRLRSLRYSLEATVGDPAAELARIVETMEADRSSQTKLPQASKKAPLPEFEPSEATVIRIRTADAFSARDNNESIYAARRVIDRFEDEETRLAQISDGQMRILHDQDSVQPGRDSNEVTTAAPPLRDSDSLLQPPGRYQIEDEATRMRPPVNADLEDSEIPATDTPLHLREQPTGYHLPQERHAPQERHMPQERRSAPPQGKPGEIIRATEQMSRQFPVPDVAPPPARSRQPSAAPAPASASQPSHSQPSYSQPSHAQPPHAQPPHAQPSPPMAPFAQPAQPYLAPPQPFAPPTPEPQSFATPTPGIAQPVVAPMKPSAPVMPFPSQFGAWAPPAAAQRHQPEMPMQQPDRRPSYPPQRPSLPPLAGGQRPRTGLQPWMLVVGALVMAAMAFAITRFLLHS